MFRDLARSSNLAPVNNALLINAPAHWAVRPMRTLIRGRGERNRPDLPLLSVARERGVFVRSTDDDNHNAIPEDLTNYKVALQGDLVINKMKAWQGSLGIAPVDGIVSPAYYVYKLSLANRFFGEALLRSKPYVALLAAASDGVRIGQWDLSVQRFRELPVLVPPSGEQADIVKYLGHAHTRIDRTISAKRKLIALLDEQRRAVIHRAVTRGIDASAPLRDSGIPWLGEVPAHWDVIPLKRVVDVSGGMTPSKEKPHYWVGEYPWVSPKDMKIRHVLDSIDHVSDAALDETSLSLIEPGAVLMVVRGMILARKVPVAVNQVPVTINQDMKALRPRPGISADFLLTSLEGLQSGLLSMTSESGHGTKRLDSVSWERFEIARPPIGEQAVVSAYIDSSIATAEAIAARVNSEIGLLREFRARLTSDVVTGQLDVRRIAATLPDLTEEMLENSVDDADTVLEDAEEYLEEVDA